MAATARAVGRGRRAIVEALDIRLVDATADLARAALDAFERYGRPSPGILNMGDCFAYALAKREDAPLLFKSHDFGRTDVKAALA